MAPARSAQEIRQSIQTTRTELTASVNALEAKVDETRNQVTRYVNGLKATVREITDWRGHLRRNSTVALAGAAGAGFVLGGGLTGLFGLFSRG